MKINIITQKIARNKDNAFWYQGCEIATIEHKGIKLTIEARGEIRLQFEPNGTAYKNQQAIDEAVIRKLTDKKLDKIGEFDGWHNNNWFAICEVDNTGNIGDDLEIAHTYSDAIKVAKSLIKDLVVSN